MYILFVIWLLFALSLSLMIIVEYNLQDVYTIISEQFIFDKFPLCVLHEGGWGIICAVAMTTKSKRGTPISAVIKSEEHPYYQ